MSQILPHDWFPQPIPENVRVGERSWIYSSFAFLHYLSRAQCGVKIGDDSGVYHGTFFELGPEGRVEIGDFCTVVGAIIHTNGRVVIEDYAFIAHEVVIADSPFAVPHAAGRAPASENRDIVIGRNSWVGARAILLPGAKIGEGAIVGAAAAVDFEVPPFAIVAGNPATVVGWARPQGEAAGR
jgi:acetyltransferase-like isoleucine patch superfamily enzyme